LLILICLGYTNCASCNIAPQADGLSANFRVV
jgi:hypothetical protein